LPDAYQVAPLHGEMPQIHWQTSTRNRAMPCHSN
jgi:hypothetical protein